MVQTIRYKKGDTAPLSYIIEGYNPETQGSTIYDLSSKTVTFSMVMDGVATWLVYGSPATVVNPSRGLVQFDFTADHTATAGMYRILWHVLDDEGKIATFPDGATQWLFIMDDQVM